MTLQRKLGTVLLPMVIASILFGLLHSPTYEYWSQSVFAIGIPCYKCAYSLSRNIFIAYCVHLFFDWIFWFLIGRLLNEINEFHSTCKATIIMI
ncbi:type II CAAX prenyl endopeptidase Rce1 family protein [Siminovitchia sediminis]|uniref:Type II CAAX prenyl endopeptidase Rce1 family protein n=1 Tax=Siminovitchia sediminis TaxID=1274353 RepID=A0ABW4KMD4_9BACI